MKKSKSIALRKAGHRSWGQRSCPVPGMHAGDIMSTEKRSALMSRIRSKGTGPERAIGLQLRSRRLRFETHSRDLPGRPDVVFRERKIAVFIDGDYWHGWRFALWEHKLSTRWRKKIAQNRERDLRNFRRLRSAGWRVLRLWEHQVERDPEACLAKIERLLKNISRDVNT